MKRYIKNVAHTSYVMLTHQRYFIESLTEIREYIEQEISRDKLSDISIEIIIIYEAFSFCSFPKISSIWTIFLLLEIEKKIK